MEHVLEELQREQAAATTAATSIEHVLEELQREQAAATAAATTATAATSTQVLQLPPPRREASLAGGGGTCARGGVAAAVLLKRRSQLAVLRPRVSLAPAAAPPHRPLPST